MDSQLDLEELNKQMLFFQNDFQTNPQKQIQNQQYEKDVSTINFQPPPDSPMQTTQIKKPTKTSGHRNDINNKLNNINMEIPMINDMHSNSGNIPNMMPQFSRNNSNYMEVEQSSSSSPSSTKNHVAQYYNNNYSTLQGDNSQHPRIQQDDISNIIMQQNSFNQQGNINQFNGQNITNTHTGGMSFINVRNMYENQEPNQNNQNNQIKINDTGFHKVDEKRIDYRQNMNNKIDNFIFENPNATPFNPILQQAQSQNSFQRDTRMVIQDSSKDYYRQESNSRMSQYSPLSRASNVPINIANMSVNDFYANMQIPNNSANSIISSQEDNKAVLNSRMGQYAPLSRNIQYQKQSNSITTQQQQQSQSPSQIPIQKQQNLVFGNMQNQIPMQIPMQIPKQNPYTKPNVWNPNEVNLKTNNVYFNQLPVMSNK